MMIQGGPGGQFAAVSSANRVMAVGESFDPDEIGSLITPQQTFVWTSGSVTLTTTGESGVIAIQNTSQIPLLVRYLQLGFGKSTGGTPANALIKLYAAASAITGTLVSSGTNTPGYSRNLGVTTQAQSAMYPGTEGRTITNGTVIDNYMLRDNSFFSIPGAGLVLPYNAAFALSCTPGASNTSMIVVATIIGTYLPLTEAVV